MTHESWLQSLAEIGIGFAGFSALIAGMRRREEYPDPENTSRGHAVVETSLSVLFGCMTPVLLHGLGLPEIAAFRFSGCLFLLAGVPLSIHGFRRAAATRNPSSPRQPVVTALSIASGLAGLGFSLACVIGSPQDLVPTFYLGALVGTLGIAAVNFAGFVFAMNHDVVVKTDTPG